MTGIRTGSFEREAVARATASLRLLGVVVAAALLGVGGCAKAPAPSATTGESSTVTTSIAGPATSSGQPETSPSTPASSTPGTASAPANGAPIDGEVALGDTGDIQDLARDELEGYTARPVEKTTYELRRSYTPEDPGAFREIGVVLRRFAAARAASAAARQLASKGRGPQAMKVSGLEGIAVADGSSQVLLLPNGRVLVELRITGSAAPAALRNEMKDVAEALLD